MEPKRSLLHSLSLSWASLIQSIPPHPTSWRSILILSSPLCLGLPSDLFPSGFPTITLNLPLLSPVHTTCPAHLIGYLWNTLCNLYFLSIINNNMVGLWTTNIWCTVLKFCVWKICNCSVILKIVWNRNDEGIWTLLCMKIVSLHQKLMIYIGQYSIWRQVGIMRLLVELLVCPSLECHNIGWFIMDCTIHLTIWILIHLCSKMNVHM